LPFAIQAVLEGQVSRSRAETPAALLPSPTTSLPSRSSPQTYNDSRICSSPRSPCRASQNQLPCYSSSSDLGIPMGLFRCVLSPRQWNKAEHLYQQRTLPKYAPLPAPRCPMLTRVLTSSCPIRLSGSPKASSTATGRKGQRPPPLMSSVRYLGPLGATGS
jgi:hypothetical protein